MANTITSLAMLYERQGEFARAEALYQRTLHIDEKTLGPDNPIVATQWRGSASGIANCKDRGACCAREGRR